MFRLFILGAFIQLSTSANILGVFTSNSKSHVIIHKAVADALIDAGHNLTIISSDSLDGNRNFRHVYIPEKLETKSDKDYHLDKVLKGVGVKNLFIHNVAAISTISRHQKEVLFNRKIQETLKDSSFDLVILGYFFNDFQLVIPAQLKVPVIVSWLAAPTNIVNNFVGNSNDQSYVPNVFLSNEETIMSFPRRIANTVINGAFYIADKILNYIFNNIYK